MPQSGRSSHSVTDTLPTLGRELLIRLWCELQATVPQCTVEKPVNKSIARCGALVAAPFAISVPSAEVPRLVRRLDCATLRILDQIHAIRYLYKECPEVMDVAARIRD